MKNQTFPRRLANAVGGFRTGWREASFRVQLGGAAFAFAVLCLARPSPGWWAAFALSVGAVLTTELLNTALERALDVLHPSQHPEIGRAKDAAAAAVLVASGVSLAVFAAFLVAQLS